MRILKFNVDKQLIERDPNCDFGGLVPGTKAYLKVQFSFSQEWDGFVKIATFWSVMGREFPPQILKDGKTCIIPAEALENRHFGIRVIGKKEKQRLVTNTEYVCMSGRR